MQDDGRIPASAAEDYAAGSGRTAAILSGGAGTRIGGREKGLLPLGASTFIEAKISTLSSVFSSVLIVTARPGLYRFLESQRRGNGNLTRVRVVEDAVEGCGALGGIYTALRAAESAEAAEAESAGSGEPVKRGPVFITTSDTPFLEPGLAAALFIGAIEGSFDVFIPRWRGLIEPLCGVYSLGCIPAIEQTLPKRKIRLFYPLVTTGHLPEERVRRIDPEGKSFININTEEDYRRYIGPGP